MITRRAFVATAVAALCGLSEAIAQGKTRKVAFLMPTSADPHFWDALKKQLAALGYIEGRNIVFESRSAEGRFERLPALAAELVAGRPDVIVAAATPPVQAAKAASTTIPIVIATASDPVKSGLVSSFARPGGNVTGISNMSGETTPKLIELARSVLPKLSRTAILWNPANPAAPRALAAARDAAAQAGIGAVEFTAKLPADIDVAFAAVAREPTGALVVLSDPFLVGQRERIGSLARAHGVAVFAEMRELVGAGALISYGPDFVEQFRRAAHFVDRILKGAKPSELPIEQVATFALVVNRRTAAALGIKIPQEVLLRATEVID